MQACKGKVGSQLQKVYVQQLTRVWLLYEKWHNSIVHQHLTSTCTGMDEAWCIEARTWVLNNAAVL